jgi:glutamate--cysteine ligase
VVALVAALLDDPAARAVATAAATEASAALGADAGGWLSPAMQVATRDAMTDPVLREAGMTFVATAVGALTRAGQPELAAAVAAFGERYPARHRGPADDRATDRATALRGEPHEPTFDSASPTT